MFKKLILSMLGFFICQLGFTKPNNYREVPVDPLVIKGVLENGMTYYIVHSDERARVGSFFLFHHVGSIQEDDNQRGLAHFLEHMGIKGLENFTSNPMRDRFFRRIGASGQYFTSYEYTQYHIRHAMVTRKDAIDSIFLALQDWSHIGKFNENDFERERAVVTEEIRRSLSGDSRVEEASRDVHYNGAKYARRSVLGTFESIASFTLEDMKAFNDKWYRPDLQMVVAVGDFDVYEIEKSLKSVMSKIPKPTTPNPRKTIIIPGNKQPRIGIFTDPEHSHTRVNINMRRQVDNKNYATVETFRKRHMAKLVVHMLEKRMNQIAAQNSHIQYIRTYEQYTTETCEAVAVTAYIKDGTAARTYPLLERELERVRQHGFSHQELLDARKEYDKNIDEYAKSSNKKTAGEYLDQFISDYRQIQPYTNKFTYRKYYYDTLGDLSTDEINDFARTIITRENQSIMVRSPLAEGIDLPTEGEILTLWKNIKKEKLEPFVFTQRQSASSGSQSTKNSEKELFVRHLTPGEIVAVEDGIRGSKIWTLDNGIKVVVAKTATKDPISMRAVAFGGLASLSDAQMPTGMIYQDYINSVGIGGLSSSELKNILKRKKVEANLSVDRHTNSFSATFDKSGMETAFQLLHMRLSELDFDRVALSKYVGERLEKYAYAKPTAARAFSDSLFIYRYQHSPRWMTLKDAFDKAHFDDLKSIHRKLFGNPGDFYFVIAGNFAEEMLQEMCKKYLATLTVTSTHKREVIDDGLSKPDKDVHAVFTYPTLTPRSSMMLRYTGPIDPRQETRLTMSIFSELYRGFLANWIRWENGAAYAVSSVDLGIDKYPYGNFEVSITFDTAPEKVEGLLGALTAALEKIAKDGPDAETLARIKRSSLAMRERLTDFNEEVSSDIVKYYMDGEDVLAEHVRIVNSIDAEKIKAFARQLLAGTLTTVVMNPE